MMWNTAGVSGKNRCGSRDSSGAFFAMFHPPWIYPLRIYCTARVAGSRRYVRKIFLSYLNTKEMQHHPVREYLDLVKFSHTLFALPFALLGAVLAAHDRDGWHGRLQDWVGILLCMAAARSAAMAFNRLADRHFDALNPRTAGRHLPGGRLSVRAVAVFTLASSLAFVASPCSSCPIDGRCTSRCRSCSGCWVIPTASDSPAWLISGSASR